MRRVSCVVVLLLAGCGGGPVLSGLQLSGDGTSFTLKDGERTLLASAAGPDVAPVAVRQGRARTEMKYGSFRFTELPGDWTSAARFRWTSRGTGEASGEWLDADGKGVVRVRASEAGAGGVKLRYEAVDGAMNRLSLGFRCEEADRFLGFGAQADGVDHRGHTVAIWTSEPGIGKRMEDDAYPDVWFLEGTRHASSYGLPTWVSNRGYLGVVEAPERTVFEVCSARADTFRVEAWGNALTLWVFAGEPATALERATGQVLGRPMRPPPMAFAPWNDAVKGPDEVRRVAKLLRDRRIPSSALWTEDFRGGEQAPTGYRLVEDWDVDRELYPEPEAMAAELADAGFAWHAYFNTFLVEDTPVFDAAAAGNHFVKAPDGGTYLFEGVTFKPTGLADLSRPETRDFVKGYLRDALDVGFTGWMADYGEWLPADAVLASGEPAARAHNLYPVEWAKLNAEVMAERASDGVQRVYFVRAGFLGSNALAPVVWAGDQRTSFQADDGLPTVVPMGLNLGLAGVSTYGHDIAGYQSGTNPGSTKELFFRWTALGAVSPVMRTHHGIRPEVNWAFDKDEETLAHWARWARFHVQLFPWLDGHSAVAERTGIPLMRSLVLGFPRDARAWGISDEYELGAGLLVAPVVTEGATARRVYLPEGEWVALSTGERFTGPRELDVLAPMTEVPLFLRAGTCVPRLPERVETLLPAAPPVVDLEDVQGERVLWLAPGGSSVFTERDGTTYRVEAGEGGSFAEGGEALPDCTGAAARGCVDRSGPRPVVRLAGQGPLRFPGGRLTVTGPARTLDVEWMGP